MKIRKKVEKRLKPRILSERDEKILDELSENIERIDKHLFEAATEDSKMMQYHVDRVVELERDSLRIIEKFSNKDLQKDARKLMKTNIKLQIESLKRLGY
jgi:hypothetical protein